MKMKLNYILIILALILLFNAFYVIDERQQVIITQFGKPVGDAITNAGLRIKIPFIQKVHYFDTVVIEPFSVSKEPTFLAIDSRFIQNKMVFT